MRSMTLPESKAYLNGGLLNGRRVSIAATDAGAPAEISIVEGGFVLTYRLRKARVPRKGSRAPLVHDYDYSSAVPEGGSK